VEEEFAAIHACDVHLRDVWPRSGILERAHEVAALDSDLRDVLNSLQDEWNEGEVPFCKF